MPWSSVALVKRDCPTPTIEIFLQKAQEHLGVGIVVSKTARKFLSSVQPISARNICAQFLMQAGVLDVVSTYAPQACHQDAESNSAILDTAYAYSPKIKALPNERATIGPYTFGASTHELTFLSDRQLANRSNMVEFCLEHRLVVANTLFQQSTEHLVTYRSVGVSQWDHPFHFHKYAQLDSILVNSRWKSSILNVSSTYAHALDTDHKLLKADVKFKLKAKAPPQPVNTLKFHTPNLAQLSHYNTTIVRSKLLYSLECIQPTTADISRLNAFQNKSLRRILGIPPTFIDRE